MTIVPCRYMENLEGKKAPNFTLLDQDGHSHSKDDYKENLVLLYFYPKDMTPGCTVEAKCFRDSLNDLKASNVQVLGVSADSVKSHKKFAEEQGLNFPLLSDPDKETIKAYGVLKEKSMFGKKYMGISRESFLIGKDGNVMKHYTDVKNSLHAEEVLADVNTLDN